MKIGIIVAMGGEFRLVEALLSGKKEQERRGYRYVTGQLGEKEIVLTQCGIGKVCAAVGTVEMIRYFSPDYILNTGVAGGIDARLRVMDMVVGKEVVYHDVWCGTGNEMGQVQGMPARYKADSKLLSAALSVTSDIALCEGLICNQLPETSFDVLRKPKNVRGGIGRRYGKRSDRTGVSYVCDTFFELPDNQRYARASRKSCFAISGFLDSCA